MCIINDVCAYGYAMNCVVDVYGVQGFADSHGGLRRIRCCVVFHDATVSYNDDIVLVTSCDSRDFGESGVYGCSVYSEQ